LPAAPRVLRPGVGRAPARRPGERQHVVVEPRRARRPPRERDDGRQRKPLYHRCHRHYIPGRSPRENRSSRPGATEFSDPGEACFGEGTAAMALPLMPKATAVWLVENTTLTFQQIADFCGLHELEVNGIAD